MHKNAVPVWAAIVFLFAFAFGWAIGTGWSDENAVTMLAASLIMAFFLAGYHMGVSDARESLRKEREGQ